MSTVAKITGQILGLSNGPDLAPYTMLTVQPSGPSAPISLLVLSPTDLSGWQVGQSMTAYFATAPTDISAIEAAVSVVQLDSSA